MIYNSEDNSQESRTIINQQLKRKDCTFYFDEIILGKHIFSKFYEDNQN